MKTIKNENEDLIPYRSKFGLSLLEFMAMLAMIGIVADVLLHWIL